MKRLFGLLPSLFLLGGCADDGKRDPPAEPIAFDTVVMHRSACYGFCPVYTITISSSGKVEFSGEQHVAAVGDFTKQIELSEIRRLSKSIGDADFFQLREQYRYESDGCTEWWTDNPTVDIVVIAGDRQHRVSYYYGCTIDVRERIDGLAAVIDEVGETENWIGPRAL